MFVPRNDVESKVNGTYFSSEDGAFHWKGFLVTCVYVWLYICVNISIYD